MTSDLKRHIRDVPDFPKPGIMFRDLTPVLEDPKLFREVIDRLTERHSDLSPSCGYDVGYGSALACLDWSP